MAYEKKLVRISPETMEELYIKDLTLIQDTINEMLESYLIHKPYVKVGCKFETGAGIHNKMTWNKVFDIQKSTSDVFTGDSSSVTVQTVFDEILKFCNRALVMDIIEHYGEISVFTLYGNEYEDSSIHFILNWKASYIYYQYYILGNKEYEKYLNVYVLVWV